MQTVFMTLLILMAVVLIVLVLIQRGKGGGLRRLGRHGRPERLRHQGGRSVHQDHHVGGRLLVPPVHRHRQVEGGGGRGTDERRHPAARQQQSAPASPAAPTGKTAPATGRPAAEAPLPRRWADAEGVLTPCS